MSAHFLQVGPLVLLGLIALVGAIGAVMLVRAVHALKAQQEATHKILASRDLGPVLHGLVQQTREVNRLLTNIDKRLEKLEALQKVQIASLSLRDDAVRPRR